jgi:hypothetical protein
MHEFIPGPDDVLAVKISGTITGEDLDTIMDRAEAIMAKHDKIHFYVETHDIQGMQISAMPHHMSRSFPMFGKLDRFGRVAVVADQAWMRVATRLESAMLPHISYRVYEPEDRAEALAWALGETVPA